ncbi:MAG: hypothetical protein NVS3B21_21070 [Acidimicrobiales bacterium]
MVGQRLHHRVGVEIDHLEALIALAGVRALPLTPVGDHCEIPAWYDGCGDREIAKRRHHASGRDPSA